MFDPKELERLIKEQLNSAIEDYLETLAKSENWLNELKHRIVEHTVRDLTAELRSNNFSKTVQQNLAKIFEDYTNDNIKSGIDDQADSIELTVMNGCVVAENDFVATTINATETITTSKLVANTIETNWEDLAENVTSRVTQKFSGQLQDEIVARVVEIAKSSIDFENVSIGGSLLVSGDTLSKKIRKTNISQLGTLTDLHVAGETLIGSTFVNKKRMGINTQEPSMSLDVWDEEVQVSIGKKSERTAYVGSNRLQNLQIGVNGKGNITITDKNIVIVENLQIDKNRISWGTDVPGTQGGKGDVVFNANVSSKNPVFAWMCVGGHNWVALNATIS
jgi:hypothetical protein